MLVRIRSRDGNFRFELQPSDDISALVQKILETSETIDPETLALSNAPRGGENLVSTITGDLQTLGISHGDLLFASYKTKDISAAPAPVPTPAPQVTASTLSGKVIPVEAPAASPSAPSTSAPRVNGGKKPWEEVKEDEVDVYWGKQDGKIERKKGTDLCKCGPKSMCDYCMPLEPYDSEYQSSHGIKHLSYHSYLRKINSSAPLSAQSTSWIPPLSNPSYQVQVPCTSGSHPSWPAGICTKCQPSAVTLSRQTWRMVDHVEFASPALIDGMLDFWRKTGSQRFGYMLGRYEPYSEVPMGIKAVVEAIHEPPQEGHADGVTVGFPWEEQQRVERLAEACGLKVVGMVYTDLLANHDADTSKDEGPVQPKRHANSFFLSSLEVIFSATLQSQHPSPSRFSDSGAFSSKFVTVVISGDGKGNIVPEAYQVSDQAMAMVKADMVEASVDPGVMRVKEEGPTRYIPDVFFRYKNKYGIEVKESAKPCFPVEYLIVNVTHGFPLNPSPLFTSSAPFITENRASLPSQSQSMTAVASSFARATKDIPRSLLGYDGGADDVKGKGREQDAEELKKVAAWLSDWHLLAYLDETGIFDPKDIRQMAQVASQKDTTALLELLRSPSWQTFLTIAEEQAPATNRSNGNTNGGDAQSQQFIDGFEIPPDVDVPPEAFGQHQDVDMDAGGGGGGGGAAGGVKVCPHCTFENDAGATDCDVCGLPLS